MDIYLQSFERYFYRSTTHNSRISLTRTQGHGNRLIRWFEQHTTYGQGGSGIGREHRGFYFFCSIRSVSVPVNSMDKALAQ